MNELWRARLMRLDRRLLAALLGAGLLFVALEAWLQVLRSPLTEWRALAAMRQVEQAAVAPTSAPAEIERLTQVVARTEQQLNAAMPVPRSDDDTVLFLIGALDRLGIRHGVALGAVRPGGRGLAQGFEATSFEVEARGSYVALTDWVRDAQAAIAPLVLTELTMTVAGEDRRLALKMKVTAYSQASGAPGGR